MPTLRGDGTRALWVLLGALLAGPAGSAQVQFNVDGRAVEIHGFFTQGFIYSNKNNYLTMNSSDGSFAFTDGGLNVSTRITEKFRVGAQGYVRNVGQLGHGHVTLDWASGDYRFNDYFGIRAGKVKTLLGLYNDTQDVEFLHTWALLPQSLYPLDLRGLTISHIGADVYGAVSPRRLGTFSYTAHVGILPADRAGGNQYGLAAFGQYIRTTSGNSQGLDVKWNTPVEGLLVGAAFLNSPQHLGGDNLAAGGSFHTDASEHTTVLSAQYTQGPFRVEYERSRLTSISTVLTPYGAFGPPEIIVPLDRRGWYAAAAFRISKRLEIGAYHSRFYPNNNRQVAYQSYLDWPARHIFDQAFTARFDIKSYLDLKVEGHLMDGYGDPESMRGFYPQDNPNGLKPRTNLLVIRLGLNF